MAKRRSAKQKTPRNPHAARFKVLLDDPERSTDFLHFSLPASIRRRLAAEPPELVDGTFIDDSVADHQGDLLFRVKLKSGKFIYVHVILESSSDVDPSMAFAVFRYQVRIWEREMEAPDRKPGPLTPIVTLVVYHGNRPWTAPLSLNELIAGPPALLSQTEEFGYYLVDLNQLE